MWAVQHPASVLGAEGSSCCRIASAFILILFPPGTTKRLSVQGEDKASSASLTLQKGSNFHTMPANLAKVHLQNVVDYPSQTLSLRRDKGATKGISTELPGAKSIYICDSELFKQLDTDAARGSAEGGGEAAGRSQGYVLLPGASSTLKTPKGKEEPGAKPPHTRLVQLSGSGSAEPGPGPGPAFGLKTLPTDQLTGSCSERDSPAHLQNLPRDPKGAGGVSEAGESGSAPIANKSETVSTLSTSSLEVRVHVIGTVHANA